MFWKIVEIISRVVSARRIRHVNRVGEATALAHTDPEKALERLDAIESSLHSAVKSMHALVYGRILDGLGRIEEAEAKIILAAKRDPSNLHAHLELAKMSARRFQFKNAKERLQRIAEEPQSEVVEQAGALLEKLADIKSGKEAERYTAIARRAAKLRVGPDEEILGLPANLELIDNWITVDPKAAVTHFDDLMILIGESVAIRGGRWKIGLYPRNSIVVLPEGNTVSPFEILTNRFTDSSLSILKRISAESQS